MAVYKEKAYQWLEPEEYINVTKNMHNRANDLHEHEFIELEYIFSGNGYQIINGVAYNVSKGDMIFFNLGDSHMFIPDGQIGILNCLIDPRFIQRERVIEEMTGNMLRLTSFQPKVSENGRVNMPIPLVSFDSKGMSEVENLLDSILEEFHKKKPGYIDAMKSYLNVILIKFLRVLDSNMDNREVLKNIFRITPDIFAYIEENFQRRITLKELAEYSFYNPSYFSTIFKESFGITITDFMQIKRYKASLDYVTGTDLPFDEVATLVGFCDKKQFYKVFKKFSNMLPNRYRTNFRKSNLSRKSS